MWKFIEFETPTSASHFRGRLAGKKTTSGILLSQRSSSSGATNSKEFTSFWVRLKVQPAVHAYDRMMWYCEGRKNAFICWGLSKYAHLNCVLRPLANGQKGTGLQFVAALASQPQQRDRQRWLSRYYLCGCYGSFVGFFVCAGKVNGNRVRRYNLPEARGLSNEPRQGFYRLRIRWRWVLSLSVSNNRKCIFCLTQYLVIRGDNKHLATLNNSFLINIPPFEGIRTCHTLCESCWVACRTGSWSPIAILLTLVPPDYVQVHTWIQ